MRPKHVANPSLSWLLLMCSSSICLWWNKLLMTKQLSVSRAGGIHPLWTQHVFLVVALYFFVYKRAGYVFTISMYVLPFLIYFQFEICIYLYSILTLRWLVKPQGSIFHCSWTLKQHVYMTVMVIQFQAEKMFEFLQIIRCWIIYPRDCQTKTHNHKTSLLLLQWQWSSLLP